MLSRWVGSRAPPRRRALSNDAAKDPGEVRLVCQAAFEGDLTQRFFCREHQPLRPLHAAPDDVSVWRFADTVTECNIEVVFAEASGGREIPVSHMRAQVRFDVCKHFANLPRCETSPYAVLYPLR